MHGADGPVPVWQNGNYYVVLTTVTDDSADIEYYRLELSRRLRVGGAGPSLMARALSESLTCPGQCTT